MANRKWPKWVVGISSVLSFTGFLYVTQGQQDEENISRDSGEWAAAKDNNVIQQSTLQTSKTNAQPFLYSKKSMQQIAGLSDDDKSEREKMLEKLMWEADPGAEITIPAPGSSKISSGPAVKKSQPATTFTTRSTRKTRRS
ncbi:hypothetical protein [Paenibacillus sp.]|uniref:hypothetical protein n=1 Tax=Paenibacillus sp. TaxID=58172 RepID=UPI00282D6C6E|nr:hypothetical protein [Paenibacillus sp.]MDR0267257.1 hypothetical protein [Paenibacillus sp.]